MKKLITILLAISFSLTMQTESNAMTMPIKVTMKESAVQVASSFIGTRYCRGGQSPRCFDCSGLTQYVYSKVGINMPRIAGSQLKMMTRITQQEAVAGDLVFYSTKSGYIYHVGIYMGNGTMLHAPKPGRRVRVDPVFSRPIYAKYS